MKTLIKILQVLLGLWNITGGIYMSTHYEALLTEWALITFPSFFWVILGVLEVVLGIALVVSVGKGKLRKWAPVSAGILAVIALLGMLWYSSYAGFPGVLWAIIPAILLGVVAYSGTKR